MKRRTSLPVCFLIALLLSTLRVPEASASLAMFFFGSTSQMGIDDNSLLDQDPAVGRMRVGGPAAPLVVDGLEFSARGASWRRDGVQYVKLSDAMISGMGSDEFFVQLFDVQTLPALMNGYGSNWSQFRFVDPMVPENHANVLASGGLGHNDIDTAFPGLGRGTIDGVPGAESIVFGPSAEDPFVFYTPLYGIWTEVVIQSLRTDIENHLAFESQMTLRFPNWVPEPSSGPVWIAFALMMLKVAGTLRVP